eukprot:13603122-Alexandrium_andersonii.AAC.1
MVALDQGDEGRGGKVRFLFGALMVQPSEGDLDDPRTPVSALNRCVCLNWVKACSGLTSMPWSTDDSYGALMTIDGSL